MIHKLYAMRADVIWIIIQLSGHSNADFEYIIIRTISCDYNIIVVCSTSTTPLLVCHKIK